MVARPAIPLLLAALLIAGCSGGGGKAGTGSPSPSSDPNVSISASATAGPPSSATASNSASPSTGPAPLSGNVARDVTDNSFPDGTFTLKAGSTVTWTDKGTNPHSVTADDGAFDSSPNCPPVCMASLPGANTFSHEFDAPGSFSYHCKVHATMTGTITVVA